MSIRFNFVPHPADGCGQGVFIHKVPIGIPQFLKKHLPGQNILRVENVIIDYRDRPAGSESKLNTYSDGFRVLRTIARLYKNYRPFGFFSTLAAVLGIISLCFLAPVLGEYFATGLVPRFPTLIVCACVLVAALLLFISGVILSSQLTKDDRDFEFHLQQVQQWKNRSADPFSHSAK